MRGPGPRRREFGPAAAGEHPGREAITRDAPQELLTLPVAKVSVDFDEPPAGMVAAVRVHEYGALVEAPCVMSLASDVARERGEARAEGGVDGAQGVGFFDADASAELDEGREPEFVFFTSIPCSSRSCAKSTSS